jgi:hypothetical protein
MTLYAQSGPAVRRADAQAATQVGRYRLQSNPWVNLHQRLIHEARFQTARSLARRGVRDYRPSIAGMYERGFRGFEQSLETHWQAYLDGKVSREAAIRQILIETAPPKK